MSVGTVTRMRRRARQGHINAQATTLTLRRETGGPSLSAHDMRVIYPQPMGGGPARAIDREQWSRVIVELLETEAGGNRTRLAEMIGVKYLTIKRWIDGTHSVSEENVRALARAFKLSAIDLLIRVGYYRPDELAYEVGPPEVVPVADKPAAIIDAADVSPSVKRELREYVAKKRSEYEEAITKDVIRWIELERRARRSA